MNKIKVYRVDPCAAYNGFALIAATSADEANKYIVDFKKRDANNKYDSYGWWYVDEDNVIEDLTATRCGIIFDHIYYSG